MTSMNFVSLLILKNLEFVAVEIIRQQSWAKNLYFHDKAKEDPEHQYINYCMEINQYQ